MDLQDRILMALAFIMIASPTLAGIATGDAIRIPEPASITVFGAAVVGAYVIRRFMSRK